MYSLSPGTGFGVDVGNGVRVGHGVGVGAGVGASVGVGVGVGSAQEATSTRSRPMVTAMGLEPAFASPGTSPAQVIKPVLHLAVSTTTVPWL